MTRNEKWSMTIRCLQLVRANYRLLRSGRIRSTDPRKRRQMRALMRWLEVIDEACREMKTRRGKSPARARRDWLAGRTIEMMIYDGADDEKIRAHLTGPRPLTGGYVSALTEEGILRVMETADERGLFPGERREV